MSWGCCSLQSLWRRGNQKREPSEEPNQSLISPSAHTSAKKLSTTATPSIESTPSGRKHCLWQFCCSFASVPFLSTVCLRLHHSIKQHNGYICSSDNVLISLPSMQRVKALGNPDFRSLSMAVGDWHAIATLIKWFSVNFFIEWEERWDFLAFSLWNQLKDEQTIMSRFKKKRVPLVWWDTV